MEFSVDLGQLVGDISQRFTTTQADIQAALDGQKKRIQERTWSGVDIDGAPFAPYAKSTGKTGPVTLGDLPDAIQTQVLGSEEGHVFIPAPKDVIALAHNMGTSRMPQRHFFGISDLDKAEIQSEIQAAVLKRAKA
jgi:hypothetical protein